LRPPTNLRYRSGSFFSAGATSATGRTLGASLFFAFFDVFARRPWRAKEVEYYADQHNHQSHWELREGQNGW